MWDQSSSDRHSCLPATLQNLMTTLSAEEVRASVDAILEACGDLLVKIASEPSRLVPNPAVDTKPLDQKIAHYQQLLDSADLKIRQALLIKHRQSQTRQNELPDVKEEPIVEAVQEEEQPKPEPEPVFEDLTGHDSIRNNGGGFGFDEYQFGNADAGVLGGNDDLFGNGNGDPIDFGYFD